MGRREITTGITMVLLCGLLVLGAVWGWRSLFADLPDEDVTAEPTPPPCTPQQVDAGQRIRSSQVRVNVFNGGTRSGLADQTMSRLAKRGFERGQVGNAPSDVNVRRVAVWSTQENDAEALLVARQFGKRVKVTVSDSDLGPGVDVIVGNGFRGFVQAPRSMKVKAPEEVCVPAETTSPDTNAAGATN